MPTYEYLCQECGQRLEVFQKFSAKPLRVHDECGGRLQKVFHASGVVFKGSGYYVTDSRNGSKTSSDETKSTVKSDSKSGESKKAEPSKKAAETTKTESKTTDAAAASR
ncbi:MAG TPA: FmdB family zinc ribbon protein [Acidimicrobiia bacterium]|nr:FmdB family zinc ribbon protein [Acidimicrobiia bacterium]